MVCIKKWKKIKIRDSGKAINPIEYKGMKYNKWNLKWLRTRKVKMIMILCCNCIIGNGTQEQQQQTCDLINKRCTFPSGTYYKSMEQWFSLVFVKHIERMTNHSYRTWIDCINQFRWMVNVFEDIKQIVP